MTSKHLREAARKHWFWIALILLAFAGYQLGKDRALRDNAVERATHNPA
jgi:hypothetical protein